MDKAQNELFKSYIRARLLVFKEQGYGWYGEGHGIRPYETHYMIKNNLLSKDKKIDGHHVAEMIKYDPKLYTDKDIQPYLNLISDASKSNIIQNRPEFIDIFGPETIDSFKSDYMGSIIGAQPQLIDRFDLNKLSQHDIIRILSKQPQFIDRFESALRDLDGQGKMRFLFDLRGHSLSQSDEELQKKQRRKYVEAFADYPQYREIFKDELKEQYGYIVVDMLHRDYTLLPYLDLNKFEDHSLAHLLEHFPQLIKEINPENIKTVGDWVLRRLLEKRPQLKPYFTHKTV